jgi:DNA polymerase
MDRRRAEILRTLGIERYVPRAGTSAAAIGAPAVAPAPAEESAAPTRAERGFVTSGSAEDLRAGGQRSAPASVGGTAQPATAAAQASDAEIATLDWDALQRTVAACTRCGLEATRTQTVFGIGDAAADWMVVGEAPGAEEDRRGEPFVGRAGQLLDSMLRALGLARGQGVYIANVLKCRPPGNRDPQPREVACCQPYLQRQIALIRPKLILCVGRIAAQNLLGSDLPLGKLRGRAHRLEPSGTPVVVTYHPAYLLRSPAEKRKAWADLQYAREVASGHGA